MLAEQAHSEAGVAGIGFEKMAKTIGVRWKALDPAEFERCKQLANEDMARYRREMDAYHHKLAMKGRKEREESSRRRQEAEQAEQQSRQLALTERVLSAQLGNPFGRGVAGGTAGPHIEHVAVDTHNTRAESAQAQVRQGIPVSSLISLPRSRLESLLTAPNQQYLLQAAYGWGSQGHISLLNNHRDELLRSNLANPLRANNQANQDLYPPLSPGFQQHLLLHSVQQAKRGANLQTSGFGTLSPVAASAVAERLSDRGRFVSGGNRACPSEGWR